MIQDHLDWQYQDHSPFISVFRHEQHARNWIALREDRDYCDICLINLKMVDAVYSMKQLVKALEITPNLKPETYRDEVVVVNEIPAAAIVAFCEWGTQRVWKRKDGVRTLIEGRPVLSSPFFGYARVLN